MSVDYRIFGGLKMPDKNFKFNQKVFCLYVNVTSFYVSFKIEQGKFLDVKADEYWLVEHTDEDCNYLQSKDIFENEEEAMKHLIGILSKKVESKK